MRERSIPLEEMRCDAMKRKNFQVYSFIHSFICLNQPIPTTHSLALGGPSRILKKGKQGKQGGREEKKKKGEKVVCM